MTTSRVIENLAEQLEICLNQIDNQILELTRQATEIMHVRVVEVKDHKGNFVLIPLLTAKANALAALVYLQKGRDDAG